MKLPVNNISTSDVNGPGNRLVIWVQGCPLRCKGCFNPQTHTFQGGERINVEDLIEKIKSMENIDGVSFSGGEPLEYAEEIRYIIQHIPKHLTTIIYSGYTVDEALQDEKKLKTILCSDMSIMGRYNESLPHPYAGKKFVRTTERIDMSYFQQLYTIEYAIGNRGIIKSGIFKAQ